MPRHYLLRSARPTHQDTRKQRYSCKRPPAERAGLHRNFHIVVERNASQPTVDTLFAQLTPLGATAVELASRISEEEIGWIPMALHITCAARVLRCRPDALSRRAKDNRLELATAAAAASMLFVPVVIRGVPVLISRAISGSQRAARQPPSYPGD